MSNVHKTVQGDYSNLMKIEHCNLLQFEYTLVCINAFSLMDLFCTFQLFTDIRLEKRQTLLNLSGAVLSSMYRD